MKGHESSGVLFQFSISHGTQLALARSVGSGCGFLGEAKGIQDLNS